MAKPKAGTQARQGAYERQQQRLAQARADVTERLIKAYKEHPDREYAEEMYGSMLRERGIDPKGL